MAASGSTFSSFFAHPMACPELIELDTDYRLAFLPDHLEASEFLNYQPCRALEAEYQVQIRMFAAVVVHPTAALG